MQDDINKQPNYIVLQLLTIQSCSYNMHHVIQHDCTHRYNMQGEEESICMLSTDYMHAVYNNHYVMKLSANGFSLQAAVQPLHTC